MSEPLGWLAGGGEMGARTRAFDWSAGGGGIQCPSDRVPRLEFIGLYPTDETLIAQVAVAAIALLGFWLNGRRRPPVEVASA